MALFNIKSIHGLLCSTEHGSSNPDCSAKIFCRPSHESGAHAHSNGGLTGDPTGPVTRSVFWAPMGCFLYICTLHQETSGQVLKSLPVHRVHRGQPGSQKGGEQARPSWAPQRLSRARGAKPAKGGSLNHPRLHLPTFNLNKTNLLAAHKGCPALRGELGSSSACLLSFPNVFDLS